MTAVGLGAGVLGCVLVGVGRGVNAKRGVVVLAGVNLISVVSVFGNFVKMATTAYEVSSCASNLEGL